MESSEFLSHSSRSSVQNSSELLAQGTGNEDRKSESEQYHQKSKKRCEDIPLPETCILSKTESLKYHTTEFSSSGYKKCNGEIGVPITYLSTHCVQQFSIIGLGRDGMGITVSKDDFEEIKKINNNCRPSHIRIIVNGKPIEPYNRIIIRRKADA